MSKPKMVCVFLIATFFGGMTAALTKGAVAVVPPVLFVAIRFSVAFAVILLACGKKIWANFKKEDIKPVLLVSLFMGGGFSLYNMALMFTSATTACFFFSLSNLMIPFLAKWINGTPYRKGLLAGLAVTMAGMYFLVTDGGSFSVNKGDLLALSSAVFFALQVVFTGRYAQKVNSSVLAGLQFLFVALIAAGVSLVLGESFSLSGYGPGEWSAILFAGVLGTALLYLTQTYAQIRLTETTVAIIYAFIPLFTASTAWVFLGERLSFTGIGGGGLMIIGIIAASLLNRPATANDIV